MKSRSTPLPAALAGIGMVMAATAWSQDGTRILVERRPDQTTIQKLTLECPVVIQQSGDRGGTWSEEMQVYTLHLHSNWSRAGIPQQPNMLPEHMLHNVPLADNGWYDWSVKRWRPFDRFHENYIVLHGPSSDAQTARDHGEGNASPWVRLATVENQCSSSNDQRDCQKQGAVTIDRLKRDVAVKRDSLELVAIPRAYVNPVMSDVQAVELNGDTFGCTFRHYSPHQYGGSVGARTCGWLVQQHVPRRPRDTTQCKLIDYRAPPLRIGF